ncbi:MAG: type II/IV secretion system protein [bacterium]|nr:type II/IV secretion system protein [bacterium]
MQNNTNNINANFIRINLSSYLIDENLIKSVSGSIVKKYNFMPVFKIGETLTIATSDPDNLLMLDEIRASLECEVDALFADKVDIQDAINQYYGMLDLIENQMIEAAQRKDIQKGVIVKDIFDISSDNLSDSSIINLVNLIVNQALLKRASDIHIVPIEEELLVRLRVDGEMTEMKRMPKNLLYPIISRIKVMGGMDIAETRLPQDGHIKTKVEGKVIELRVSSLPTISGENVVMRILKKGDILFGLEQLGFAGKSLKSFKEIISVPYGMILVTGPTGSGKTTTLYAALNELNQETSNIITLEDPVEHELEMVRQVQVNPRAGLTFASGLRSILRQDPDIIMVGEIRDLETIELAIRSALTGHLVFSTLHTNDAPSSLIRMVDMGVEPFLVSSAVLCILAQRLVKKICQRCKKDYKPTEDEIRLLGLDPDKEYFKGKGCKNCRQTGYSGRIGIFELFILDEDVKLMLQKRPSSAELREMILNKGMKGLREDGIEKIEAGITTPEEVMKAVQFLGSS